MARKLFLFIFFPFVALSQTDTNSHKHFADGPLKIGDFRAAIPDGDYEGSFLKFGLSLEDREKRANDTTFEYMGVEAWMDRGASYLNLTSSYKQHLKYNQILFNTLELERRSLEQDLLHVRDIQEYEDFSGWGTSSVQTAMAKVREQTKNGTDGTAVDTLLRKTETRLGQRDKLDFPKLSEDLRGWTLGFAPKASFFTGEAGELLADAFGFGYGIGYLWNNFNLLQSSQINFGRVTEHIAAPGGAWPKDAVDIGLFDVQVGYSLYNNSRFTITPALGFSLLAFVYPADTRDYPDAQTLYRTVHGPAISAAVDYKLTRQMSHVRTRNRKYDLRYTENQLRLIVKYIPVFASQAFSGSMLNIGIGWGWISKRHDLAKTGRKHQSL